jgi:hypothetical protein
MADNEDAGPKITALVLSGVQLIWIKLSGVRVAN